ncbi:MAG: hypothetical protein ACXWNK_03440 [Vulcanimicrobiaceae bacterium]
MHSTIVRTAATLVILAASAGCGGGGTVSDSVGTPSGPTWKAFVVQPTTPVFVVGPTQPVIIVIQLVPVNGFFIGAPVFFNNFIFANPNLTFACPGLLTISTPILGQPTFGGFPFIQVPLAPIGFGSCALPINLGLGGVFVLNVQVNGSPGISSTRRVYSVRVTGDWKRQ